MSLSAAAGVGLATQAASGKILDCWYPLVTVDDELIATVDDEIASPPTGSVELTTTHVDAGSRSAPLARAIKAVTAGRVENPSLHTQRFATLTRIDDLQAPPADAQDVYLRLHLLSRRLARPHEINLDGAFGLLSNVVWTDLGPADPETFDVVRVEQAAEGRPIRVTSVDKFPRMTDYVVPSGVRIADADRVRLGAHLAPGTTVMHEGFVNFNAGTLGASMVEGRISAGVVVGDGSDIGGGASIMGTLSGGGTEVIRIGEGCLIGANAGLGISLGDGCVVEAGLYVTAGTKITLDDGRVIKARELSGVDGVLFRRDSRSGAVVALAADGSGGWRGLNAELHAND